MEKDNLTTVTVHDPSGDLFELTDQMKKWGYEVRRNGQVDKKGNQFMHIYPGPNGYTRGIDNNGSLVEWRGGGWQYIVKDNKTNAGKQLIADGQVNIFTGEKPKSTVTQQVVDLMKPITSSQNAKELVDKAIQQLPPPESSLGLPLGGTSPVFMQQGTNADPTIQPAGLPLPTAQASGFSFSNPWIIGGMLVAVVIMVVLAKKFG